MFVTDRTGRIHTQEAKFKLSQRFKSKSWINVILNIYLLPCSWMLHENEGREEALVRVTMPPHTALGLVVHSELLELETSCVVLAQIPELAPAAGRDMLIICQEVSESIFMFYFHSVLYSVFYNGLSVILMMVEGWVGIDKPQVIKNSLMCQLYFLNFTIGLNTLWQGNTKLWYFLSLNQLVISEGGPRKGRCW